MGAPTSKHFQPPPISSPQESDRYSQELERYSQELDHFPQEPKIELPKLEPLQLDPTFELPDLRTPDLRTQQIQDEDLDFGMLWRELAGLRLDEVFALSRLNLFSDSKTR